MLMVKWGPCPIAGGVIPGRAPPPPGDKHGAFPRSCFQDGLLSLVKVWLFSQGFAAASRVLLSVQYAPVTGEYFGDSCGPGEPFAGR